jgi:hypothetical protein
MSILIAAEPESSRERVRELKSKERTYQGEVGEHQTNELVDKFDVEQDFSHDCMIRFPDLSEMDERVHGREEGAIEPASSLGYELRNCVWNH